jgi:hypothetical protein
MTGPERADRFDGAWAVVEYVFDPDGTFRGVVDQRRLVEPVADGHLRVTQICRSSPELAGHPMAAFEGEWVFDLYVDGDDRRYVGPDVVGLGTQWAPGAITGSGQWPRFGYDFESYGVLIAPERQLTGGFFSLVGRSVADIVGVAAPESFGVPSLDLDVTPPDLDDDTWTLQRTVGPMRLGQRRPTPDVRERIWTMRDAQSDTTIAVTERVAGHQRIVDIATT